MRFRIVFSIIVLTAISVSCTINNNKATSTIEQINSLLELNGSDTTTIARILNVSDSEIAAVLSGEKPYPAALCDRAEEVYNYALNKGHSLLRIRAKYDSNFAWYDHILLSPIVHPWLFWTITAILLLLLIFRRPLLYHIRHAYDVYSDEFYDWVYYISLYGFFCEAAIFLIALIFHFILK